MLGFLISAGIAVAQGVAGASAAKKSGEAQNAATRQQAAYNRQAYGVQIQALRASGRTAVEAAGIGMDAARLDAESVIAQEAEAIFSQILETDEIERQFEANIDTAEYEISLEKAKAVRARQASKVREGDFRRETSAQIASNVAVRAASGITNEGSAYRVDEAIFSEMEQGVGRILHAGDQEANLHLIEGEKLRRFVANEKVSLDVNRIVGAQNLKNIKKTGSIALRGASLSFKSAALHKAAAKIDTIYQVGGAQISRSNAGLASNLQIARTNAEVGSAVTSAYLGAASGVFKAAAKTDTFKSASASFGNSIATMGRFN